MARPVKWSRDLHPLRERAARARIETWSRQDIEGLFGIGRASAHSLMKAIGQVQAVGGAHFVERPALLAFLDAMIAAPSIEEALRRRLLGISAAPVDDWNREDCRVASGSCPYQLLPRHSWWQRVAWA